MERETEPVKSQDPLLNTTSYGMPYAAAYRDPSPAEVAEIKSYEGYKSALETAREFTIDMNVVIAIWDHGSY